MYQEHTGMYLYVPVHSGMRSTRGSGCLAAASPAWVVWLWRRLPWRKAVCEEHHQNEACVWFMSIPVCTSMYQYILICTCMTWQLGSNQAFPRRTKHAFTLCQFGGLNEAKIFFTWTLHFLKFDFILSYLLHRACTLLNLTLRSLPGCMRKSHVFFQKRTCTYQYVPVRTSAG